MNELCVIEAVNVAGIMTVISTAAPLQLFSQRSLTLCSRAPLHEAMPFTLTIRRGANWKVTTKASNPLTYSLRSPVAAGNAVQVHTRFPAATGLRDL